MKKELQDELFKKYPKLFRQTSLSQETCMCWGIDCGDGWFNLLDNLCNLLQFDIDYNNHPNLEFTQIKEKFGSLNIYYTGGDEKQEGMISFAEFLSSSICEMCGFNQNVKQTTGWIYTLCESCMKEKDK